MPKASKAPKAPKAPRELIVCPKAGNGRDLIARACGDLTWLKKSYSERIFYDENLNDKKLREEIQSRASGYVAKGNLQDALYIYEALHRMEALYYRPLEFSYDSRVYLLGTFNPLQLADLHLRRENFFQAELVPEEYLIFLDSKTFGDKDETERTFRSLIDLYKKFRARILAYDPYGFAYQIIMCRVARVDNTQLWKDLSLAALIPPLNHIRLGRAKKFKAPNLLQLILDQEDYVQDPPDSDEISLRTAPGGESATASDVVADPLGSGLPLHKAVIRDSWSELLPLLDEGNVHIDSRDKYKNTPSILAVCLG
ncbi:MAG: hypothetical protein Q9203_007261 [Teloschistes exilis]